MFQGNYLLHWTRKFQYWEKQPEFSDSFLPLFCQFHVSFSIKYLLDSIHRHQTSFFGVVAIRNRRFLDNQNAVFVTTTTRPFKTFDFVINIYVDF